MKEQEKKRDQIYDDDDSHFFRKEDIEDGFVGQIQEVVLENVAPRGEEPQPKRVVLFVNSARALVLKSKDLRRKMAAATGSKYYDDWAGKWVELYVDPTIMFKGKVVGGIRARAVSDKGNGESQSSEPRPHRPVGINEPTSTDFDEDTMNAELAASASR